MNIWLYPIIGFCVTAIAIGLAQVLGRLLRRPNRFYKSEKSDG